jgi:acetylornithine aminotransferase
LCDSNDLLMLVDEIQTGNGRTGTYFCYQQCGFMPDVVTTAKGLGNGVPIGACLARGRAAEILQPGNHGSTYGGNPLACAAGVAVVNTIVNENLTDNAAKMGQYLRDQFTARLAGKEQLVSIRGRGLMVGLVINQDCPQLMAAALDKGLLLNVTAGNVVRLLPPLNLTQTDADQIVEIVSQLIEALN